MDVKRVFPVVFAVKSTEEHGSTVVIERPKAGRIIGQLCRRYDSSVFLL